MYRVCFHHLPFDEDVSSGTDHALHQWVELLMGFGVSEAAVIDEVGIGEFQFPAQLEVTRYSTLDLFLKATSNHTFVEQGGPDFRTVSVGPDTWLIFGGWRTLPKPDISLPTTTAFYAREAAAIVLGGLTWPLR